MSDMTMATLVRHYAEVRKRLIGTPVKVVPEPVPEPEPAPKQPPDWREMSIQWEKTFKGSVEPDGRILEVKDIVRLVCKGENVALTDFYSRRRTKDLTLPRHIIAWLAKTITLKSLPTIGKAIGRDHTTVLSSVKKINDLRVRDQNLQNKLNNYARQVRNG